MIAAGHSMMVAVLGPSGAIHQVTLNLFVKSDCKAPQTRHARIHERKPSSATDATLHCAAELFQG